MQAMRDKQVIPCNEEIVTFQTQVLESKPTSVKCFLFFYSLGAIQINFIRTIVLQTYQVWWVIYAVLSFINKVVNLPTHEKKKYK